MKTLQQEHSVWLHAMFPHQDKMFPAVGIVEESAELLHAMLKFAQHNVWGPEARYASADWRAKMTDAVGDCALYVCSYCNTVGWQFDVLCKAVPAIGEAVPLTRGTRLVGAAVTFVDMQTWDSAYLYMSELRGISEALHIDFHDAIRTTWAEVKLRCR